MATQTHALPHPDPLAKPMLGSVLLHVGVVAFFVLLTAQFEKTRETWGSSKPSAGGAVAITPVSTIPLPPRRGPKNPVANDTDSVVPQAPRQEKAKEKAPPPDPDAIALKTRKKYKPEPVIASTQRYRPPDPYRTNQVYSSQAPAAVSPMFAQKGGPGQIGLDQNSVLGSRFGAYAMLLMQRVSEHWRTNGLDSARLPFATVSVDLFRNGTIRNAKLVEGSGNYQLDTSAVRAVTEAAPFPPLPAEYERDMVNVEFKFQIKQ